MCRTDFALFTYYKENKRSLRVNTVTILDFYFIYCRTLILESSRTAFQHPYAEVAKVS